MTSVSIPNTSGIYKITCTANGKMYIGSAVHLLRRKRDHFYRLKGNRHGNLHMQRAWNKYGPESFAFEVLELILPMSLTAREQYWLNKLHPFGNKGFNMAVEAGSCLGVKRTPEQIERSRHPQAPETREKIRQGHIGIKPSLATIEAARKVNIGRKHTPEEIEKSRQGHIDSSVLLKHVKK